MKRFLTIVAATAVAAAITIPAVADSGSSPSDELATFATCMRAHGVPIPADLEGVAIKQWVGEHADAAGLEAAFEACDPHPRDGDKADNAAPEKLVACLRTKGLEPPASLNDLKPWILQQSETAGGKDALKACGFAGVAEKPAVEDGGPCGGASKARASRAGRAKARTTPTT